MDANLQNVIGKMETRPPLELPRAATLGNIHLAQTTEDASAFVAAYSAHLDARFPSKPLREDFANWSELCLHNIGYWAGYYPATECNRILALFDVKHPVYGPILPTPKTGVA